MSAFPARYPGTCGHCYGLFVAGVLIRYDEDRLVHNDCQSGFEEFDATAKICPTCHLTLPCGCEDD